MLAKYIDSPRPQKGTKIDGKTTIRLFYLLTMQGLISLCWETGLA